MRRALVLAALIAPIAPLGPLGLAAAAPPPSIAAQVSLRDFFRGMADQLQALAPLDCRSRQTGLPDLSILTIEPVARTESSGYGWREDPIRKRQKFHTGTDFRAKPGTPVVAAGNGIVTFAGRRGGYGNVVFVDHGGGVITRYAHLRRIHTKTGDMLAAGDRVGAVGSTGRTTGPHLHFEVRLEGRPVDPVTALTVAELLRENPEAGHLAALALAPAVQAKSRDLHDSKNRQAARPERRNAPKRQASLW